jgi:hypothetical protein
MACFYFLQILFIYVGSLSWSSRIIQYVIFGEGKYFSTYFMLNLSVNGGWQFMVQDKNMPQLDGWWLCSLW